MTENSLYPLKFKPIYKEKIWGGNKLAEILGRNFSPLSNCGESWELSDIEDDVSVVTNGFLQENDLRDLIEVYMYDLMGEENYLRYGLGFPLLIKLIDASDDLSVQVHPDDELATKYGQNGKTEIWYVLDADKDAGLYVGFKENVRKETYLKAVQDGIVDQLLNFYPVQKGDVFLIPAGTVHAIGKGVLLSEIQQASDVTFRIFDWNRVDEYGRSRELHTEEAMQAIHFEEVYDGKIQYELKKNITYPLLRNAYFNINILSFDKPLQKLYSDIDSFVIYICTEGEVHFLFNEEIIELKKGECLLKPAALETLNLVPLVPDSILLEVYVTQTNSNEE